MPKMKTHKGAAKRFRTTGSGKIVRRKAYKSHLLGNKSKNQKRRLSKTVVIDKSDDKRIRRLLGI